MLKIGHRISGKEKIMAGPENMAEVPPPEEGGPEEDPLAEPTIPERDPRTGRRLSQFERILLRHDHYNEIPSETLSTQDRQRLEGIRRQNRGNIQRFVDDAGSRGILEHVRGEALKFYKQVKAARRSEIESRYQSRQEIIDRSKAAYRETFWGRTANLRELQRTFGGVAEYVWEGIVESIDMEENRDASLPLNETGKKIFEEIKKRRERDRLKEKKYTTEYVFGGTVDILNWPERPEEFTPAILEWIRDKVGPLWNEDPETANNKLKEYRMRGVDMIRDRKVRLEEEGVEISDYNPYFLEAIASVEAVTDVLGYEMIIYKGGEEYATEFERRFSSGYIRHHDAIYLAPKVAYILRRLKTWKGKEHRDHDPKVCKGGTYWTGHDWDVEKALEGQIADHRRQMAEKEIIDDAETHDPFVNVISKNFLGIEDVFKYREDPNFRREYLENHPGLRPGDKDIPYSLKYSFQDPIDQLLLDPGDQIRQRIAAQYGENSDEVKRHEIRVRVFRDIKEDADRKDGFVNPDGSLMTEGQRQQRIRQIILAKMQEKEGGRYIENMTSKYLGDSNAPGDFGELEWGNMTGGTQGYDRALWQWVNNYNQYWIELNPPRFYPTGWDRVRWNIDRPEKVLDRFLTEEQFEAMFEPVPPPDKLDYEDEKVRDVMNASRFAFQLARGYQIFNLEDVILGGIRTRDVDPDTGEYRDPKHKLKRVFDIVQEDLENAISKEREELYAIRKEWRDAEEQLKATKESGDQARIDAARNVRETKYKAWVEATQTAVFLATHALKEAGLVEGKLPVWSYNYLDQSTIHAFAQVLADYGVHVAYGRPITHNNKRTIYHIIESEHRAYKTAWDDAAEKFMDGTYPVFEEDEEGKVIFDEHGNRKPAEAYFMAEREFWDPDEPIYLRERYRITAKGAVKQHRQIVDTRFELSTTGGVRVQELNSSFGDLGYVPPYVRMGVLDARGWHGYMKRRDEVEFHEHKFFDTMDPVNDADERRAAYTAYKTLTGGVLGEGKSTPGQLQEPFKGAYKTADLLRSWGEEKYQLNTYKMKATEDYLVLVQKWRESDGNLSKEDTEKMEALRQMSYEDFNKLPKPMQDALFEIIAEGLTYLRDYFQAEEPVEEKRPGKTFRNLPYTNWLKFNAFREKVREAEGLGERGFVIRLGYAREIASEVGLRMLETVLGDDFKILRPHERVRLAQLAALMKARGKTEQLSVSGLQKLMAVEGYVLVNRDGKRIDQNGRLLRRDEPSVRVLGTKIPELVRRKMENTDPVHNLLVSP